MDQGRDVARFSAFTFDLTTGELRKDGRHVKLHPQPARVLTLLVRAEGGFVTREAIQNALWGEETFVDYDLGINSCVRQIRAVLGDDAEHPKFVETVPRIGYRFLPALEPAGKSEPSEGASQPRAGLVSKGSRSALAAVAAGLSALAVAAYLFLESGSPPDVGRSPIEIAFTQITSDEGEETNPSLSPDGESVVYASRASGTWDIYLQRVGGQTRFNLTKSAFDDTQPAFAPVGASIAFRSERDGGGIFLMGATGESVRRVTHDGFNPAWSPDGRRLVVAPLRFLNPVHGPVGESRELVVVDVSTGGKRTVAEGRFLQPSWSPNGSRIAFWTIQNGARDIWTAGAEGGTITKVTDDAALDWNPVWSPDGKYLYFSSDRGGSINLWRVPVEETTGEALGTPEPITTPTFNAGYISMSRSGRRFAYGAATVRGNLYKIAFDARLGEVAGEALAVTRGSRYFLAPDVSPDGESLVAHVALGQEDLFVISTDGERIRQLTDDSHRDRFPRWSPDGNRIAFYSTRSGSYEIWTVNRDGSEPRQLTHYPAGSRLSNPVWSPDGSRIAYTDSTVAHILDLASGVESTPESWRRESDRGVTFMPRSWSPDGRWLAGHFRSDAGERGLALHSFESGELTELLPYGSYAVWLADSRHLVFQAGSYLESRLMMVDRETGESHVLFAPTDAGAMYPSISRDNRTLYFTRSTKESDIWLATLQETS